MSVSGVRLRGLFGALVLSLAVVGLVGPASSPAQADPSTSAELPITEPSITESPDAASAALAARVQGHRVEDLSQRTETTQVFAKPDGGWTSEQSLSPVRAKNEQGEWADIDLTLEKVGGGYAPANALGGLVVSDGGDQTFAELTVEGRELGWQWPTVLPEPRIEGNTATYPGVVEAGDLVVTATVSGFRHDVVLHRAPTEPVAFEIPVVTQGPRISEDASGGLSVETQAGNELVTAPPPVMYDAPDPVTGESEHVAPVDTAVTQTASGGVVTLDPEESFLTDPSTVYPVTIDPNYFSNNGDDTWIYDTNKSAVHPYDDTLYAGALNSGTTRYRSFLKFGGELRWGKSVIGSATLTLRNFNSVGTDCAGAAVEVRRVTEGWSPGSLNWNNQPATTTANAATNTARKGGSTGCPADDVTWNVKGIVQTWANNAFSYPDGDDRWIPETVHGFRVAAFDETKNGSYREYRSDSYDTTAPRLNVDYYFPPNTPTQLGMVNSSGHTCGEWMPSGPNTMPSFKATLTDPTSGDQLYGTFAAERYAGAGTWQALPVQTSIPTSSGSAVTVLMAESNAQVNGVFRDGWYRVRVQARDQTGLVSAYSGYCDFFLDSTNPVLNATIDKTVRDGSGNESVQPYDHAGGEWLDKATDTKLNLHLDPGGSGAVDATGQPDATLYSDVDLYRLESDVPGIDGLEVDPAAIGVSGDFSIDLTDVPSGFHWVYPVAVDRAGRTSESSVAEVRAAGTFLFRVRGAKQIAQYNLDEGSGTTLGGFDIGEPVLSPFTLAGTGTSFEVQDPDVPEDFVLHFDGSGRAVADAPMVDTTRAFSVSVWARTSDVASRHVVVAQRSGTAGTFSLAIEPAPAAPGKAQAVFTVAGAGGSVQTVRSATLLDPGKWYLLAGSYDDLPTPRRLQVWVGTSTPFVIKSVPDARTDLPTGYALPASASTSLGAELIGGVWLNGWAGDIEDVRFWAGEMSGADVNAHRQDNTPQ